MRQRLGWSLDLATLSCCCKRLFVFGSVGRKENASVAAANAVANQVGVRNGAHVILRPAGRVVLEMDESIVNFVRLGVGVLPCHGGVILIDFAHLVFHWGQVLFLHAAFDSREVVHNFQQVFALFISSCLLADTTINENWEATRIFGWFADYDAPSTVECLARLAL